ncbi:hypothetical protein [Mycobacterium ulcerans]|uniref:hypothetical protein n=1 Tax=Mycobacterium ulcerans TaxID=1809 RepID=UPI001FFC7A18|nr:hypothetical protein [Mycobacterium ulcerans]
MGDRIDASALVLGHGDDVRRRLTRSVAVLRQMVEAGWFAGHEDTIGMEVELDLVGTRWAGRDWSTTRFYRPWTEPICSTSLASSMSS